MMTFNVKTQLFRAAEILLRSWLWPTYSRKSSQCTEIRYSFECAKQQAL